MPWQLVLLNCGASSDFRGSSEPALILGLCGLSLNTPWEIFCLKVLEDLLLVHFSHFSPQECNPRYSRISALEYWTRLSRDSWSLYSRQSHSLRRQPRFQGHPQNFPHAWTKWLHSDLGNIPGWPRNLHFIFEQEYFHTSLRVFLDAGNSVTDRHVFSLFWKKKLSCLCVCCGGVGQSGWLCHSTLQLWFMWHFTLRNGISLRHCCKLRWDDNVFLKCLKRVRDSSEVTRVKCYMELLTGCVKIFWHSSKLRVREEGSIKSPSDMKLPVVLCVIAMPQD